MFPTEYHEVIGRLKSINPELYSKTRNYKDGELSRLSPYISRGVISTSQIFKYISELDLPWWQCEKYIQELAWRDYWQQVWIHKGDNIFFDINYSQEPTNRVGVPSAILMAETGISAVDDAINELYSTGYMHNHMRMYVASIAVNIAKVRWKEVAQWMYAHLLDGDLASNHLSWQWVAGCFSGKKYYANQDNINKYFYTNQKNTFLDIDYRDFESMPIPSALVETVKSNINYSFPSSMDVEEISSQDTLIYNYYNLDPLWHNEEDFQRILLLEPSVFKKFPVSQNSMDFALELSNNISGIKVFVGEFDDLQKRITSKIIFKEHPLSNHYVGIKEEREWMTRINGHFPSFFKFWKLASRELNKSI